MKALITGATSGIGRDMAVILAKQGIDLIIASRDTKKMEQIAKRLPVNVKTITVDLSKEADCYYLYEETKNENIDILINNAGFGAFGPSWEVPLETELNMIDLNIRAVHILTKLFLADFREKDSGYILNVASSAGFLAGPLMSTYYATKSYVLRFTEAIHEELRREGSHVKISALCPGHVETGFDKRANVKHSIGGVSARSVAKSGIDGVFRGDVVILPGVLMKLTYIGEKFLTEPLMLKAAYYAQSKKG
ncbi:MAG: SDR family oxidoreductase [Anaerotignum sp.]|nr:SDR family oxidoreductase [Anaerotignum sp.]